MATPAPTSPIPADIAALSFEEALAELERIVRQVEEGRAKLDDAIAAYERGVLLKRHCEAKLKDAQARIEQIALASDGSAQTRPFSDS